MNKSVDFAGPLVFNGTVKRSVIERRQQMNSGYILGVHVFLYCLHLHVCITEWAPFGHPTQGSRWDMNASIGCLRKTQSHKTSKRHDCKFSCLPSCHSKVPPFLFSRFSSGLMKMKGFYGCWRRWICTWLLHCIGSNVWCVSISASSSCACLCVCFLWAWLL